MAAAVSGVRSSTAARRAVAALLLVAAVAAVLVLRRSSFPFDRAAGPAPAGAATEEDIAAALERYGFFLEDVAHAAGIDFRHEAPRLDARLEPIMPLIASNGASVAVVDYDGDGWPDLYATTSSAGGRNALYRNLHDGTFEDVAPALGIADVNRAGTGVSMGSVWGDYDNDGDADLFLYKWGRPELYRNDDARAFVRVPEALGLPERLNAGTAVWLDYDRDGWLDLFVGGFYPEHVDLWNLESTRFLPESFEYARNGGRNWLLRNGGDGTFEDVAERAGLTSTRWTLAAAAGDLTRDGYPDLLVANDFGVSELYINVAGGGGSTGARNAEPLPAGAPDTGAARSGALGPGAFRAFRDVSRASNIGRSPKSGMNASLGDLMNRGEWALFVSNIAEPGILMHGNDLWLLSGSADGAPTFRNAATAIGVDAGGWTYGAQFADLNNDGWLDLAVVNGFVSGDNRDSYWYDYSKVATGYSDIIADARHWPPLEGRSLSGHQRDLFWVADGAGGLRDAAAAVHGDGAFDGRAVAVADLWNRGVLDVVIANQRGPLQVLRNTVAPGRHWIGFDLRGTRSNRGAVGAELTLFWDARRQIQQVEGGSGFAAQRDRRLHFGLGAATRVDSAVIRWPSGTTQTIAGPGIDRHHMVVETTDADGR